MLEDELYNLSHHFPSTNCYRILNRDKNCSVSAISLGLDSLQHTSNLVSSWTRNGSTNIDLALSVTSTVTTVVASPLSKLYLDLEYHYSREEEGGENTYLHACDTKGLYAEAGSYCPLLQHVYKTCKKEVPSKIA